MAIRVDKAITSDHNPVFRSFRECLSSKGIRKHGLFLVAGHRAVSETLSRFPQLVRNLLICTERHQTNSLTATITSEALKHLMSDIGKIRSLGKEAAQFSVISLTAELFDELDVTGTHFPLLALKTSEFHEADLHHQPKGLEILCGLGDPSNLGALLRSASAFNASKVILLKEAASPFHPKAVRAASATTLLTPLERGPSIQDVGQLVQDPANSPSVVALSMDGIPIDRFQWPKNVRLLIGEEGQGVPSSTTFQYVSIPMNNDVESLNATVALSIALYSYRLQHPIHSDN